MTSFAVARLLQGLVVLAIASVLLFVLLHIVPGDPAAIVAGESATPETTAEIRADLGLDRPLLEQYTSWLANSVRGDFGKSIYANRPVWSLIQPTLLPTAELAVSAMVLALLVGIPLGVLAGSKSGGFWDYFLTLFTAGGLGVPGFYLGVLALLLFAVHLDWLPTGGRVPVTEDPKQAFLHMILPASTLGLSSAAVYARFVRSAIRVSLRDDYVRTARAKGLQPSSVIMRHALPNSLIPLITIAALQVGRLLGGAAITEQVFAWPGLGKLVIDSVFSRDYLVVQGALVMFVTSFVVMNSVADVMYGVVDPRVRKR